MTEEEAVATLAHQFIGESGLIARLRGGLGIDRDAATRVILALDALSGLWSQQTTVPKAAIRALVDVVQTIRDASIQNPDVAAEIEALAEEIRARLERIFFASPMSEDEAIAVVHAQLGGMGSFLLTLHQSGVLNVRQVEEVQIALETLHQAWANRSHVPKSVVGPMLDAREAIMAEVEQDPHLETELTKVANDVGERVRRCFT